MFNEYVWKLYLSAGGKKVADMFEQNLTVEYSDTFADNICKFHREYCPSKKINSIIQSQLNNLYTDLQDGLYLFDQGEYTILSAMEFFRELVKDGDDLSNQSVFDYFQGQIEYFSTFFAMEIPDLFIPYFYKFNFNLLERIALEFNIELPPIPKKKDYEGRYFYYGEICSALYEFRTIHHMTPYELCAFLYDFAPKYVGGINSYIIKDLPEPKSVYFVGGLKDDALLDDSTDIITPWQCNLDTRAGDMIVMYLRTPVSAIDSIWRSVSIGFNDPFFYYYRCTYIAKPVQINRITQKQLQQDELFRDMPIVRKNMQGINGVELLPSQYNHLLDITKSDALRLDFIACDSNEIFIREKDVETKLIIPLIAKLGYSEEEWISQMYIEIGNHNNSLIPDFVLLPNKTPGHQSAFAIIEAKLSIPTVSYLEEVKTQARSYAKQLGAKYCAIASKEKIWVLLSDDDYTQDIFCSTWDELNMPDIFSKLRKLIGKR